MNAYMKAYIKPNVSKLDSAIANMLETEYADWCREVVDDTDYWVDQMRNNPVSDEL